jgi:hypothetical protein
MQVERGLEQSSLSGGRVRNTWVIYLEVRNTGEKSPTIPHTFGDKQSQKWRHKMSLRPISFVGGVKAYQGDNR